MEEFTIKNIFIKRIITLMLIVVMSVSTMAIAIVPTSAVTEKVTYSFDIYTAAGEGLSSDEISFIIYGDSGYSKPHNVGCVGNSRHSTASFSDIDIDNITGIIVECKSSDDWYPEYIKVTKNNDNNKTTTTFYGGRFINPSDTLTIDDEVYKIEINTASKIGAGTDGHIHITLADINNNLSNPLCANKIHPAKDAFEKGDKVTLYMYANKLGILQRIIFDNYVHENFFLSPFTHLTRGWDLEKVTVTKVSGNNNFNQTFSKTVNTTIDYDYSLYLITPI